MIAFERVVKVMEEVIKVNNLYKLYKVGDEIVHALDGVDFTVRRGEFCAIVGTSGSGKSTLLNMLAGLERPTRGSIVIGGQKIEHLSEEELVAFRREKVGFIFQSFHLLGTLNAVENVALPLSFRGEARQHRIKKAEAMIKLVGHMPNQMSGGQQQRVGVARALVVDPQIIFADEPTGNLDSHTAEEIMALMQQVVRKHNKTLVMVTHDDHLASYADRIFHIRDGKILKIGKYVFEEACRFIKKGVGTSLGIEYVQVNLSVVQCMQSDLVEQLLSIMDRYKVDPSSICLEVTETAAVYTPHIMEKNIKTLSDYGVKFALDDYGTGYSNMTYLLSLPFRFIKLEKEIVWECFKSEKAHIAIESTVAMIKKLNMQIVAEGIEDKHQLDTLLGMGCDFIQGYYFSKPVPEKDFIEVLKKNNTQAVTV